MKYLYILTAGLIALATPTAAQQQTNCAPRATVLERLSSKYGETLQASGLGGNQSVVELFAAPQSGTWTITVTLPNGLTCLVASGESYEPHLKPAGFPV
ncbi:hypothetical protein ATO10_11902 [Actibacterium atlanticum]|uniref:Lipoprotein n=1 Tax=Actibacterium atlanticum TaxID=1461693 RepID=A0A058ZK77_9RHOB|nr:hypothetical protein [Actibacterium atlanticum]KCV81615.1 hypothetical protein ATO10_11902 [Actibacterium atlanticum]